MNAKETGSSTTGSSTEAKRHEAKFAKVLDGRKQPIRGLWQRNDRFYAQLKLEDALTSEKKTCRGPGKGKARAGWTGSGQEVDFFARNQRLLQRSS